MTADGQLPPVKRGSHWSHALLLAVALLGTLISIAMFQVVVNERRAAVTAGFTRAATDRARVIEWALAERLRLLSATAAYLNTLRVPSRDQFSHFVADLLADASDARTLSWNPRVTHAQRDGFERETALQVHGFRILERSGTEGGLQRAAERDEYYPMLYIEPLAPNRGVLGFDIGSERVRREAVWQARDSAQSVASGRLQLVQDVDDEASILLMKPVYRGETPPADLNARREQFAGVVVVLVRVGELVERGLQVLGPGGVDLVLFDRNNSSGDSFLYWHQSRAGTTKSARPRAALDESGTLRAAFDIDLVGRRWQVMATPAPGMHALSVPHSAWSILLGGLALTLVSCIVLERLLNRGRRLRQDKARLETNVAVRTAELERAHRNLLRKERLAAVGELIGTVAHELRNPLGTITASFELLKLQGAQANEMQRRVIERIARNIGRCNRVIEDLLDFTRDKAAVFEPTDVDAWLDEVLEDYSVPPDARLDRAFAAEGIEVAIDRELLRRAIVNLLDNAFQAGQQREGDTTRRARVRIATGVEGAVLRIAVEDDGVGMDAATQGEMFDPLFSTKSFGTGLGLPTVARVVEQHRGTLAVDSEPGRGTRIVIALPIGRAVVVRVNLD